MKDVFRILLLLLLFGCFTIPSNAINLYSTKFCFNKSSWNSTKPINLKKNHSEKDLEDNPTISCPSDLSITTDQNCNRAVAWVEPTAPDGYFLGKPQESPGDEFPVGTTELTYFLFDSDFRLVDQCSFTITVVDDIPPVFDNCLANITADANQNCQAVVNWIVPTATDNCKGTITPTVNIPSGSAFNIGTTEVIYTATDDAGNTAQCSFFITVEDNTPPVFDNFPSDIISSSQSNSCNQVVNWSTISATDNCSNNLSVSGNFSSGDTFPLGETRVEYVAEDSNGNRNTRSFLVTVLDETPPSVIQCPSDITLYADSNCSSSTNWEMPVFMDNCDNNLTVINSHNSGDVFSTGSTEVIYTATDNSGNSIQCIFNVIVEDTISPVFSNLPADLSVQTESECQATVSWEEPTVSDNCGEVNLQVSHVSGTDFAIGETLVTYIAEDDYGNSSQYSFTVTVNDNSEPKFIGFPADTTVTASRDCSASVNWEVPQSTDCSPVKITSSAIPGDIFQLGRTYVSYTAQDSSGNISIDSFAVNVIDQQAPIITSFPADTTISVVEVCELAVSWEAPTAVDFCSDFSIISSVENGSIFPLGTSEVKYTFTDDVGNSTDSSFTISILDSSELTLVSCPDNIEAIANENGEVNVQWNEPTIESSSACSSITVESNYNSGDLFETGETLVTYRFQNQNAEIIECTFSVTVKLPELNVTISELLTPDGDNINDYWHIEGIEQFGTNEVLIVDRYGNEIYKSQAYNNEEVAWEGYNKSGQIVPRGTYYYFISISSNGKTIQRKGFIEVIR